MSKMNRVVVLGNTSSGKTTVASRLASILELPFLELDSVFHQPDWTELPTEDFRSIVGEFTSADGWVVDGSYSSHVGRDVVWPRADTVVWLDLPRRVITRRVVSRTLRRVITREELWNTNRERWTNLCSRDPYKNIVVWAWTHYEDSVANYETAIAEGLWDHAIVHRLRSRRQVESFLNSL